MYCGQMKGCGGMREVKACSGEPKSIFFVPATLIEAHVVLDTFWYNHALLFMGPSKKFISKSIAWIKARHQIRIS